MDFLSDQLFDGRKIRILMIVDAFSKLSPAIAVRFRYTGANVVAMLNRVTGLYGVPQTIRVAPNSSRVLSICGFTSMGVFWTSPVLANPPITASWRRSTARSGPHASIRTGSCLWLMPGSNVRRSDTRTMAKDHTARLGIRP
jgi:hypothetical protein